MARRVVAWHAASFEALGADHFARIAALKPELVIFGSGARLRFPAPALLRPLIDAGIGVETMDTAAACRTYNVLLAEGRSVVAATAFQPRRRCRSLTSGRVGALGASPIITGYAPRRGHLVTARRLGLATRAS